MGGCVYTGWGPYLTPDQDCPTCWPSGFVMRQSVHGAVYVYVKCGKNAGRSKTLLQTDCGVAIQWAPGIPSPGV
jgi:hypothetical protein